MSSDFKRAIVLLVFIAVAGCRVAAAADAAGQDWPEYQGGPDRNHYSPLRQINPGNVAQLQKAWEFHTGDFGAVEDNPIVVGGVLFGVTAANGIFALDAATGRELWRYYAPGHSPNILRGVTYWSGKGDRRIFFTGGEWLWALDAVTGHPIASFGDGGKISLKAGLGAQARDKSVSSTSPGTLFGDLLIMPTTVAETGDAALGSVQAFNILTGKLVWTFRTIPAPGEAGYDTWPKDAYKNINVGSANCWTGMAVDRARGILYVPTGSAAPDFWGGARKGADLFANCLVALEARTGRLLWYFQIVHHDIWDRDLPAPPNLVTLWRGGRKVDAVAQVTKMGQIFVFDRVTGASLFPIHDLPVPKSELPGEESWPAEPTPTAPEPFARQTLTEKDISPFARNRDALVAKFRSAHKGTYQPLGKYDTILFPGIVGGAEWGGAAVDPQGVMYINANEIAWLATLIDTPSELDLAGLSPGHRGYATYCAACHGAGRAGNPASGFPSLIEVGKRRTREDIAKIIGAGAGRMPGFPMLTLPDKQAVIDFLLGSEKTERGDSPAGEPVGPRPARIVEPYTLNGYSKFLDGDNYPANCPPWGTLTAIDLNSGKYLWRVTLGEIKELTAKGIPPTGTENFGGPVATASGLLFIAATEDNLIRAFAARTGKILWTAELPASGKATPSTYEAGGKQYVVIACGGRAPATTGIDPRLRRWGDSFVAFALP